MILLFLFGARYHYHHDSIGALWGNLMIPLYDITVFLFLGGFFPRRGPSSSSSSSSSVVVGGGGVVVVEVVVVVVEVEY